MPVVARRRRPSRSPLRFRARLGRRIGLACVLLALFVLRSAPVEAKAPLAGTRPNIVLVMTDDQGYAQIGRLGHPWLKTPHLDALHDASTRFTRFFVSPTCSPTRSALLTGRHDMRNGITHTILERERLSLKAVTLPQILATAGYRSGVFGKWHLGDEDEYQPNKRGFDKSFVHGAGGIGQWYDCSCADAPGNTYFDPVIRHDGTFVRTRGFCTDVFFDAALGWIKESKDRPEPFFAYVVTNAPHSPYTAKPSDAQRFLDLGFDKQAAGYYGMIENIDANMGRLMAKLTEWKLLDRTLVVFLSDNGTAGGPQTATKGPLGKLPDGTPLHFFNAGMKGLKGSPDEGGVRVPFFVRWDGHVAPGRDVDRIAAHIDVVPTLAALAGAKLPENQVEGRSLLPLLENPQAQWPDRMLYTHVGRWPVGADPNGFKTKTCSVRNQKYRFVNDTALFDMEQDPGQTTDVAAKHPEVVAKFRAAYDEWWKGTVPLMVNEGTPLSKTRPYHELFRKQSETTGIPDWKPAKY